MLTERHGDGAQVAVAGLAPDVRYCAGDVVGAALVLRGRVISPLDVLLGGCGEDVGGRQSDEECYCGREMHGWWLFGGEEMVDLEKRRRGQELQ